MSRAPTGGTYMWCPNCKKVRSCKAVPTKEVKFWLKSGQRWYRSGHDDVQWFRRGRRCLTCNHGFLTAEATEERIDELIELRDALRTIKANTEKYVKQSNAAAKSLKKLNESLAALRALKIYEKQPDDA